MLSTRQFLENKKQVRQNQTFFNDQSHSQSAIHVEEKKSMDRRLLEEINRNIEVALKEDRASTDVTTKALLRNQKGVATLLLKEKGVVAGLFLVEKVAHKVDPTVQVTIHKEEGEKILPGPLATLEGPLHSLLAMERTLINFIQHTCSIATETAHYVKVVGGTCDILDTRKTLPGHRFLQKYAVRMGGGKNHRLDLEGAILIKDNHLTEISIEKALKKGRAAHPNKRIQIEVENFKMFKEALKQRPDAIMLDNMSPDAIKQCVEENKGQVYLEASGGIKLKNIRSYAETGVDGISIGSLTHTIKGIDMSLKIRRK